MNHELESALSKSARIVADALAVARSELADLDERRNELLEQIARAEAVLQSQAGSPAPNREHTTLHEALAIVLRDHGNQWMTVRELADEVNQRALYRRKDGSEVDSNQVHSRTRNYDHMFDKQGPKVRLCEVSSA